MTVVIIKNLMVTLHTRSKVLAQVLDYISRKNKGNGVQSTLISSHTNATIKVLLRFQKILK